MPSRLVLASFSRHCVNQPTRITPPLLVYHTIFQQRHVDNPSHAACTRPCTACTHLSAACYLDGEGRAVLEQLVIVRLRQFLSLPIPPKEPLQTAIEPVDTQYDVEHYPREEERRREEDVGSCPVCED
ncbi:hypothetical protein WG66_004677 [Moniliophthora roreri]|nr:hypothetical protein WG66_004677 [Moniliophthora roreri]